MKNKAKPSMRPRQRKNTQKQKPRRRNRLTRSLPAAYTNVSRARMNSTQIANGLRVAGSDLVYKIDNESQLIDGAFVAIPANPAYWKGTRIAQLATAYTHFRPISLNFEYFPVVGTSTNGAITSGTFWNQSVTENTLTQSLVTSNGGVSHPCYVRNKSSIRLKSNLEQNLFNIDGFLNSDSNPFVFVATTTGVNGIVPGYYMANYVYELKNPVGDGNEFDTFVTTAGQLSEEDIWDHTSAVVMSETNVGLGPGTVLAVELIATVGLKTIQFFLKGSQAGILADTVIKIFRNRSKTQTKDDNQGSFNYQYIEMLTVQRPASGSYGTKLMYVTPEGQDGNRPYININSYMFSDDLSSVPSNSVYGYMFKFNAGEQRLDVYFVNTSKTDPDIADKLMLSANGYDPIDQITIGTKSLSDKIMTAPMTLYMKQITPQGEQDTQVVCNPVLGASVALVATLPSCAFAPLVETPTLLMVGKGRAIGKLKLYRNVVHQPSQTDIEKLCDDIRKMKLTSRSVLN